MSGYRQSRVPRYAMRRRATAALLGNGYASRFRSRLLEIVEGDYLRTKDFSIPESFAFELNVHDNFRWVDVESTPSAFGSQPRRLIQELATPPTDILALQLADNDLAEADKPAEVVADRIIHLARLAYIRHPFRLVIMVGALPRTKELEVSRKEYRRKARACNDRLKAAASEDLHLHYVMLRGFQRTADNKRRKPISILSDGVLPT